MLNKFNRIIATAGGIGYFPLAPGTWAAGLLALVWFYICIHSSVSITWQLISILIIVITGIYSSGKIITETVKDPRFVVIDEVAGMSVSLFLIPSQYQYYIIAFVLFRFLDIFKPLGIKQAEKLKNGWGIMSDDILAGIYCNIVLRFLILMKLW